MLSVSRHSLACSRPRNQTLALTPCDMLMTSLSASSPSSSSSISSLFFFQQPVQNNVFFASHYPWPRSKQEGSSGERRNLRFLKVNYVKDVTLLGQSEEEQFELKNPYLDMTSLRNREEAAIRFVLLLLFYFPNQFCCSFGEFFWTALGGLKAKLLWSSWGLHLIMAM